MLRLSDREPFLLPDDDLIFKVETVYDLSNAFITFQNGGAKAHFKITSKEIKVPYSVLFAGLLHFQIDIYYNGKIIKKLVGSPLQIVETETNCVLFDMLSDLDRRVLALEKQHEII